MQIAYEAPQFSAGFLVYKAETETDPLNQMRLSRQKIWFTVRKVH